MGVGVGSGDRRVDVTVVDFPVKAEPMERRLRAIRDCLDYLYGEAQAAGLPICAHLIGAAREASRDAIDRLTASPR